MGKFTELTPILKKLEFVDKFSVSYALPELFYILIWIRSNESVRRVD